MTRNYCDRCGADITGKVLKSGRAPIFSITYTRGLYTEKIDLCQRCNDKLYDWLNEIKQGVKNNG